VLGTLLELDRLTEMCRNIYFCTEEFSDASFIIVNASLYYIFLQENYLETEKSIKNEFHSYMHQCQINLETALSRLPLILAPTNENIYALILGV
jgi:glutaminase